jgi:hypothetical protein
MTDFRALCAEIVQLENEQQPDYADWKRRWNAVISRARAALAQPEPAGDVTDEELHAFWDTGFEGDFQDCRRFFHEAVEHFAFRRRAPVPPADGEVSELVTLIRQIALAWEPDACLLGNMTAGQLARAADLLQRLQPPQPVAEGEVGELVEWLKETGRELSSDLIGDAVDPLAAERFFRIAALLQHHQPPQPVAVSERPWERDGWCDEQGRCWLRGKVEGDWRLLHPTNSGVPQLKYCFSHSLPFYALPIPRSEND